MDVFIVGIYNRFIFFFVKLVSLQILLSNLMDSFDLKSVNKNNYLSRNGKNRLKFCKTQ